MTNLNHSTTDTGHGAAGNPLPPQTHQDGSSIRSASATVGPALCIASAVVGSALLGINFYGEIVGMRSAEQVPVSAWRFKNDLTIDQDTALERLKRVPGESDSDFVARATLAIRDGLVHVNRWDTHDPAAYNQRVPFAENPYLYLLGRFSNMPQIQRYHFTDYRRTLERGIGICGDHAMALSSVLDREGIDNVLLSSLSPNSGHVVVELTSGTSAGVYDADFGVLLPGITRESLNVTSVGDAYAEAGYSAKEVRGIRKAYAAGVKVFDGVYGYMGKRFIFERASYVMKWLVPAALIAMPLMIAGRRRGWLKTRA